MNNWVDQGADWRNVDDAILIQAHLNGEPKAFEVLFKKHHKDVARLVYSIVRNEALVDDVVQDVFLQVFRYLHRFEGKSAFKTWIYRITVNEALRQANRDKRWVKMPKEDLEELPQASTLMVVNGEDSPERRVLKDETVAQVRQALELLNPAHRLVLTLFYLDDLSTLEIAQILEIPEGSVKSRLFYARQNLKKTLDPLMAQPQTPLRERVTHGL